MIVEFGTWHGERLRWKALAKQGNKMLLLCQSAVITKEFHNKDEGVTWGKSSIRQWLNHDFLMNAFSEDEQRRILLTETSPNINPVFGTRYSDVTDDKVFLLSVEECQRYLKEPNDKICHPSKGLLENHGYVAANGGCWWYLRTPGCKTNYAVIFFYDGALYLNGYSVNGKSASVRPAIWTDASSLGGMSFMKISVVMVAYKNAEILLKCLQSIAKYNDIGEDLEIIVIDHSPDGETVEHIFEHCGCDKIIYSRHENKGEGSGNNFGAQFATGDILAFLDTDIILIEPVFGKIREMFQQNAKLGWLGVKLLNIDGGYELSYGPRFEYTVNTNFFIQQYVGDYNLFDPHTMFLCGADIFMQREVFQKIGGYDENIFMYHEEADLAQRMLRFAPDYTMEYCPDIRMIHVQGQSSGDTSQNLVRSLRSGFYYLKKYGLLSTDVYRKSYENLSVAALLDYLSGNGMYASDLQGLKFLEDNYDNLLGECSL